MLKLGQVPVLNIVLLVVVFMYFISIISTTFLITIPLAKGTTLATLQDMFKRKSKLARILVSLSLCDIEAYIVSVLTVVGTISYSYIHSDYTNISLVVTWLLFLIADAILYIGLKRTKLVGSSQ